MMPRTGRPRLPTALKLAKGERRPSRHNSAEPQVPQPKRLDPPADLKGRGLAEWLHVAPKLLEAGSLVETDMAALGDYCRRVSDLHDIELEVALIRRRVKKADDPEDFVALLRRQDASERRLVVMQKTVNMLRREVGCTSSSRSGIRAVKKPEVKQGAAARYMSAIKGGKA